jgi:hypothetical protein
MDDPSGTGGTGREGGDDGRRLQNGFRLLNPGDGGGEYPVAAEIPGGGPEVPAESASSEAAPEPVPALPGRGQYHRDGKVRGSAEPIPGKCGARLRGSDPPRYCTQWPARGASRCRQCGGASRRGPESSRYKTGEYSRYLKSIPRKMRQSFEAAQKSPSLRSTRAEIALTEARVDELLGRLDASPLPSWKQLLAAVKKIGLTRSQDDYDAALVELFDLIRAGAGAVGNHEKTWRELRELFQERGQLVKIEHRIVQDAKTTLSGEDVMILLDGVLRAIEDVELVTMGNRDAYRKICGAALKYMPPEAREARPPGAVIDNDISDSK